MHTLNPFKICATACQVSLTSNDSLAARIACYNNPMPNTVSVDIKGDEI